MSPVELLSAVGQAPPPPTPSGQGEAMGFAGLLSEQERPATPRGRLSVGRALMEQAEVENAGQIADPSLTPLVLPGLLTPPVARPVPAEGGPQILPAQPDGAVQSKFSGPLVLPGVPDARAAKTDGPLVLPGAPDGAEGVAKTDGAQVLPGETTVPADDVLTLLAASGVQTRAEGAADAVRRVVAQAPEVATIDTADTAVPEAGADALSLAAPVEGATAETTGAPVTSQATATPTAESAARPEPGAARVAEVAPQADTPAEAPAEPALDPLPVAARETGGPQLVRADSAAVQRMSFDAVTQVAAQIIRRLEGRSTRFEMELHPADMGRVDVRLDIDAEGRVAARLAFDNPIAAADLRGRADELRRNLEDAGFLVSDDALSFDDGEGQGGRQSFEGPERDLFARAAHAAETADAETQPALRTLARLGLDMRI